MFRIQKIQMGFFSYLCSNRSHRRNILVYFGHSDHLLDPAYYSMYKLHEFKKLSDPGALERHGFALEGLSAEIETFEAEYRRY